MVQRRTLTSERLTDEQIKQTVAAMRCTETDRAVILKQALAGSPEMRFMVYAKWRQMEKASA